MLEVTFASLGPCVPILNPSRFKCGKSTPKPNYVRLDTASAIVIKTTARVSFSLPRSTNRVNPELLGARWPVGSWRITARSAASHASVLSTKLMKNWCTFRFTDSPLVGRLVDRSRRNDQCRWLAPTPVHIVFVPRLTCGFVLVRGVRSTSIQASVAVGIDRLRRVFIVRSHFQTPQHVDPAFIRIQCHALSIRPLINGNAVT